MSSPLFPWLHSTIFLTIVLASRHYIPSHVASFPTSSRPTRFPYLLISFPFLSTVNHFLDNIVLASRRFIPSQAASFPATLTLTSLPLLSRHSIILSIFSSVSPPYAPSHLTSFPTCSTLFWLIILTFFTNSLFRQHYLQLSVYFSSFPFMLIPHTTLTTSPAPALPTLPSLPSYCPLLSPALSLAFVYFNGNLVTLIITEPWSWFLHLHVSPLSSLPLSAFYTQYIWILEHFSP